MSQTLHILNELRKERIEDAIKRYLSGMLGQQEFEDLMKLDNLDPQHVYDYIEKKKGQEDE